MVDKYNSTSDDPNEDNQRITSADDRIEVEETGTTVDLDTSSDPNIEIIEDGSAIVGQQDTPIATGFTSNLAEVLDEGYMQSLSNELVEKIEADKSSRDDWE